MARDKIVAFGVAQESFEPLKTFAQKEGGWKAATLKGLAALAGPDTDIAGIVERELTTTRGAKKAEASAETTEDGGAGEDDPSNEPLEPITDPPEQERRVAEPQTPVEAMGDLLALGVEANVTAKDKEDLGRLARQAVAQGFERINTYGSMKALRQRIRRYRESDAGVTRFRIHRLGEELTLFGHA